MMSDPLFVEERRRIILEQLKRFGRVSVKSLSELMQVSTVTIRQDLRALQESGALQRTYGGAVAREEVSNPFPELSFHVRLGKKRREKTAIAAAAVALVQEGFGVALDASTTAHALVPFLKRFNKLTVVTNSLIVAQQFLDSPQIAVHLPGGRLRRDSISIVGRPEGLPNINLNIGFFGARGVTLQNGITDVDGDEVSIKQAMRARCVSSVILVDGGKWGQVAPYTFADIDQVNRIITSQDAPPDLIDDFRAAGITVEIAAFHNDP